MANTLVSGASVPANGQAGIVAALNSVGGNQGIDPAAIAGMIHMESVWDTKAKTGQYIGLTQVGPELLVDMGLTRQEFLDLSAPKQIRAYRTWLEHYNFKGKLANLGIVLTSSPLARQAAFIQGMQFSPNGMAWKVAFANGDYSVKTTPHPQAAALGDTSIRDMTNYYRGFFQQRPPVYA
jgi:hypothetical protein